MSDWPGASAAPTNDWTLLADVTLAAPAASIDVSGIDTANRKIRGLCYGVNDATGEVLRIRYNGDTTAVYATQDVDAGGATVQAQRITGATSSGFDQSVVAAASTPRLVSFTAAKPAAATPARHVAAQAYVSAGGISLDESVGTWAGAALISQITIIKLAGNLDTGTRLLLGGSQDN